MFRLVVAMSMTIASVVFVMANTHQVNVSFVFGSPVRIRMIFLLLSTFVAGLVVAGFFTMITRLRFRRRVGQRTRTRTRQGEATAPQDDLVAE